jgi:hypothetical protein
VTFRPLFASVLPVASAVLFALIAKERPDELVPGIDPRARDRLPPLPEGMQDMVAQAMLTMADELELQGFTNAAKVYRMQAHAAPAGTAGRALQHLAEVYEAAGFDADARRLRAEADELLAGLHVS